MHKFIYFCIKLKDYAAIDLFTYTYPMGILWKLILLFKVDQNNESTTMNKVRTIDLVFLLDGSASVGEDGFRKVKKWVQDFIRQLDVESFNTQVGVVQYSHLIKER